MPGLRSTLAKDTPVAAAEFVKAKGYVGPLYNDYGWGGYLIWALRMPVAIDGRAALHGDEKIDRSVATWSGMPGWKAIRSSRQRGSCGESESSAYAVVAARFTVCAGLRRWRGGGVCAF